MGSNGKLLHAAHKCGDKLYILFPDNDSIPCTEQYLVKLGTLQDFTIWREKRTC